MALEVESRKRLSARVLEADAIRMAGLQRLSGRYTPLRSEFSLIKAGEAEAEAVAALAAERDAEAALAAARDRTRAAEHRRHDILVGATEQVAGQFGKNSDEYQSLGLKKKAEYRRS